MPADEFAAQPVVQAGAGIVQAGDLDGLAALGVRCGGLRFFEARRDGGGISGLSPAESRVPLSRRSVSSSPPSAI
ncbi:hypothetical protein [Streptomyces thermocarboxydovorans]|uniref:hypothetical protein n=1 Tax=Streptomyces thermocarboxydovorans TaxID=59298 RepID=UPI0031D1A78E